MRKILPLLLFSASFSYAGVLDVQQQRWATATIRPEKVHFVQATVAEINRNKARYTDVERVTGVPWQVVASIHQMECSGSFRLGLYCGDPLTSRTRNVPRGRPTWGAPPFGWTETAIDALRLDHLDTEDWSTISRLLQNIEAYNGLGVQRNHPDMPTAYLWSWTTVYCGGKYVRDGIWSSTAWSQQSGVCPFLLFLTK